MYRFLLFIIFSLLFTASCSLKNPLSKKPEVSYVDCPKTLILAPASKIIKDGMTLNLNKDYSMKCYISNQSPKDVITEFNFIIDVSYETINSTINDFKFVIFATNKQEDQKLFEETFVNTIQTEIEKDQIDTNITKKFEFSEKFQLEEAVYDKGLKLFIGII